MKPVSEKGIDIFELELAIKWAHAASLMDANPEVSYLFSLSEMALKEKLKRLKSPQPPNPPLTLEELREMDGEPVWVADLLIPECSCYHFVQKIGCHILLMEPRYYPAADVMIPHYCANDENQGYQNTWLAYRRKPGEDCK